MAFHNSKDVLEQSELDRISISTDFDCGAGLDLTRLSPDHYAMVIPSDPPSIEAANKYDYYFCVALKNNASQFRTVTLDAMRASYTTREAKWHPSRVPVFASEDLRTWYVLDGVEASQEHEEYRSTLPLDVGETVYLCNSLPLFPTLAEDWLRGTETENKDRASLKQIGNSAQGRDILLVTITDPSAEHSTKDRVLITSGFHPAEPDWLATTTIIELLLSDDEWARRLLQEFIFDVVLQVNPDGAVLGTNGCNAHGVNMYWEFRTGEPNSSPEAVHLWQWIEAHPPQLYLDFHCYVHQLYKDVRPYIRPLSDYSKQARPLVRAIDKRLVDLCDGRAVRGAITNLPSTLASQITRAYGTITYTKFHLHLNHGVPACRELSAEMFRAVMEPALAHRPLSEMVRATGGNHRSAVGLAPIWWERSRFGARVRSLPGFVKRKLGLAKEDLNHPYGAQGESGLAPHWRLHLWSQRQEVSPVVALTDEPLKAGSKL